MRLTATDINYKPTEATQARATQSARYTGKNLALHLEVWQFKPE